MMNFLDLSAASEEERRLITELLSDTSVVNFAEPIRSQDSSGSEQYQQHSNSHLKSNLPFQNNQQLHLKSQPIKAKQQKPQHNHQQNSRYQQNYVETNEGSLNHVHSSHLLKDSDGQYPQNQVPLPSASTAKTTNTAPPSTPYNSHSSAHNTTTTSTTNTSNNIDSNNVGAHPDGRNLYPINDNNTVNGTIKDYNYPIVPEENLATSAPTHLAKTTTTTHSSLANNATFTSNNVTQSTSTVPPHTLANQMTPMMAGDINSVIGMDLASPQPPSYPMPTPPHVTAYGPAPPPPPHHVYGGPPIFQPYAAHYIFPYNLPYPMPYVLPPTNSVVSARPQSSQPTNTIMPNNSRAHSHHPRSKLKEMPKQHHNQHQNHHNQQQSYHHQQSYRLNASPETHVELINNTSEHHEVQYEDYIPKNQQIYVQKLEENAEESKSAPAVEEVLSLDSQQPTTQEHARHMNEVADNVEVRTEEEIIKVSSDEGFDTQSSLDLSKQSHESISTSDRSRTKDTITKDKVGERLEELAPLTINDKKSRPNEETKSSGPWGSSSSKSWASLFRADGNASNSAPMNGEIDNDNGKTEPSSETNVKTSFQDTNDQEVNGTSSSNIASSKEQRSQDAARRAQDKLAPKLAQKISTISLKHSLPLLRPRGFINKGNGCYINSTLQALIACPPFYNLMKEIGELKGLKRDGSSTPILDSFAELFQNFPPLDANKKNKQVVPSEQKLPMNYLQADAIEPRCIYNVLGQIKSECLRGAQEDAEEFLSSVLNGLHEEMIGLSETLQSLHSHTSQQNGRSSDTEDNGDDINNDENLWREVGPKNRSLPIRAATVINTPIQEIFGGSLFSIRTAGKDRCGHRSPFFDLQLDISGDNVKSLQDAIKSFTATEIIQDFYCSKTKQKLDAQRRTSLDQLPPILILHLKQFFYTQDHGLKKLTKRIEYPIDFELPEGCLHDKNSDKSLKNSRSYKLLAVVYHEGKEAVKGHYLTDVYHIGSSQWIRCDDSNLKVVPAPRIENPDSSRTPYLLFYRRLNTLGPRQSSNHDNKKRS